MKVAGDHKGCPYILRFRFDGFRELFERDALCQCEWTAARAHQRLQVSAVSRLFAEIIGQGTNVGSFAALDGERERRGLRGLGWLPVDDLKTVDSDGARLHCDVLTGARAFVGGLPLKFDGRVARRYLHLRANERW